MTTPDSTRLHSRRRFLVAGGASALGAAALTACAGSSVVNTSGTVPSTLVAATAPPVTADKATLEAARSLLRTATSLEHSLVAFYEKFNAAGYLDEEAKTWGRQFADHHRTNASALETLTTEADGKPYTESNEYVDTELVEPAMKLADSGASSEKLVQLAGQLESTGAATCTLAVSSLIDGAQRQGIMAVGATNSRQAYVWRLLGNQGELAGSLPDALFPLRDALPGAASVDQASGS
ncbi:MAG TPA: ferritin-like domain-containing protein [Acidimicrobiales bacterium]|nr:ferritin-like domain-containing protein [Acidimicrobiales bacterium]